MARLFVLRRPTTCLPVGSSSAIARVVCFSTALLLLLQQELGAAASPSPEPNWIDPATPKKDYTLKTCIGKHADCVAGTAGPTELQLVFSDEFDEAGRGFALKDEDPRWTAVDMFYSRDNKEAQNYKPDAVTTEDGALKITISNTTTTANLMDTTGERPFTKPTLSGMLQSWNKFCFTGGYIDFKIKLPVDAGGIWPAAWLMGNLARAGYYKSTEGLWAYSTEKCVIRPPRWTAKAPQYCEAGRPRAAPELDVVEAGVWEGVQKTIHTMQLAPKLPPETDWDTMDPSGRYGVIYIGNETQPYLTEPGDYPGVLTYVDKKTNKTIDRPGTVLVDAFSGRSNLELSWQEEYHSFGFLWIPGQLVRWDLDYEPVFEIDQDILERVCTVVNETEMCTPKRLIPFEPMYILLNMAIMEYPGTAWAPWSRDLKFPAHMYVDFVRVFQDKKNVGCDPPEYPTQEIIACNRERYLSRDEILSRIWQLGLCPVQKDKDFIFMMAFGITSVSIVVAAVIVLALGSRYSRPAAAAVDGHVDQLRHRQHAGHYYIETGASMATVAAARPELARVARRNLMGKSGMR